jgi:hypothetical protein
MRESTFIVLDEFLPKGTTSGNAVFTGSQFNTQLGKSNQIGIHAVFDNITADASPRSLCIFIAESADGRNWTQRSNPGNTGNGGNYTATDADLIIPIAPGAVGPLQAIFSDACQGASKGSTSANTNGPLLGLVRLQCFFDNANTAGHLRISVTQRDR